MTPPTSSSIRRLQPASAPADADAERARFLAEVDAGLRRPRPELPCKWFYDQTGAELFEAICRLPEYYPTRTELGIYTERGPQLAAALPGDAHLIEFGSGEGLKTRRLIEHLEPARYTPVDIAAEQLAATAARLDEAFPWLACTPLAADFTSLDRLPDEDGRPRVLFFPGSTIGNFRPDEAIALLEGMRKLVGPDGRLVVGFDRVKDVAVLEAAYDDADGVTAAFNRNLLVRLRDELGLDVEPAAFGHRAPWNPAAERIEMHLVCEQAQTIDLPSGPVSFAPGEHILTEYSHKYTPERIEQLAAAADLTLVELASDEREWFSVAVLAA